MSVFWRKLSQHGYMIGRLPNGLVYLVHVWRIVYVVQNKNIESLCHVIYRLSQKQCSSRRCGILFMLKCHHCIDWLWHWSKQKNTILTDLINIYPSQLKVWSLQFSLLESRGGTDSNLFGWNIHILKMTYSVPLWMSVSTIKKLGMKVTFVPNAKRVRKEFFVLVFEWVSANYWVTRWSSNKDHFVQER